MVQLDSLPLSLRGTVEDRLRREQDHKAAELAEFTARVAAKKAEIDLRKRANMDKKDNHRRATINAIATRAWEKQQRDAEAQRAAIELGRSYRRQHAAVRATHEERLSRICEARTRIAKRSAVAEVMLARRMHAHSKMLRVVTKEGSRRLSLVHEEHEERLSLMSYIKELTEDCLNDTNMAEGRGRNVNDTNAATAAAYCRRTHHRKGPAFAMSMMHASDSTNTLDPLSTSCSPNLLASAFHHPTMIHGTSPCVSEGGSSRSRSPGAGGTSVPPLDVSAELLTSMFDPVQLSSHYRASLEQRSRIINKRDEVRLHKLRSAQSLRREQEERQKARAVEEQKFLEELPKLVRRARTPHLASVSSSPVSALNGRNRPKSQQQQQHSYDRDVLALPQYAVDALLDMIHHEV
eukprot:PhM_4_TR1212/c0_g1_i1/m.18991